MGEGTRSTLICLNGFKPMAEDINESVDHILAVTTDDMLVKIIEHVRIRVGAAGTGENPRVSGTFYWDDKDSVQMPAGFYDMLTGYRAAVEKEIVARSVGKKNPRVKRLREALKSLPTQLAWDHELLNEILADGLENWLREFKP